MSTTHDCKAERARCAEHDSYYCPRCDKWLDDRCHDADCMYCASRPTRPSDVGTDYDDETAIEDAYYESNKHGGGP